MTRDAGHGVHDAVSLARLDLEPEAAAELVAACRLILDAWRELPRDDAPPSPAEHPSGLSDVLRDDVPEPGLNQADALRGAPEVASGAFRVPRVADVA